MLKTITRSKKILVYITGCIGVSTTILFAGFSDNLPSPPLGEATGGVFETYFETLFQKCPNSAIMLGYSGSSISSAMQKCMDLGILKDKILSGSTDLNIQNKKCDTSIINNFVVGFSSTGAPICTEVD